MSDLTDSAPRPGAASVLVVLDADSTLLQDEVIELLAEEAGSRTEVAEITERAMRGELDFERSLRERVRTLRGLPASVFHHVGERIRVTDGVPELVAGVQAAGGVVGVVSGGFHELLDPIGERLGLDHWRANRLVVREGRLTGEVDGPVIDAAARRRRCCSGRLRRVSTCGRRSPSATVRTTCG